MEAPFEIKPGQDDVSPFPFVVHDGKVDAKLMERLWNDYADPPKVVISN